MNDAGAETGKEGPPDLPPGEGGYQLLQSGG